MRKKFLIFLLVILFGCSYHSTTIDNFSKAVRNSDTGVLLVAALIEANTNFSSLIFDKTKIKIDEVDEFVDKSISKKRVFVLPVRKSIANDHIYDMTITSLLKNYLRVNKFAIVTDDLDRADYVFMCNIISSLDKTFGENFVKVEITITDKNNNIIYYSHAKGVSNSDKNFWYFPAKSAKPTSYITLKTINYVLKKQLPKVFGRG